MKKILVSLAAMLALAMPAAAQTTTQTHAAAPIWELTFIVPQNATGPTLVFNWTMPTADLAAAQSATYAYTVQGSTASPVVLQSVTCSGTASPFPCTVTIPIGSLAGQTLTLTATSAAGTSAPSNAAAVAAVPPTPLNFTITVRIGG